MTSGTDLPALAVLVPHAGTMCLLERIVTWDEGQIEVATCSHTRPDNPLRTGGRLSGLALCEYGAQAMAVHGGLLASADGERARPGLLVSLREVDLVPDDVGTLSGELRVRATRLHGDASGWQYAFEVLHHGRCLAHGRAAVMLQR
jgi:predicted hotdog family 3-hydroxylacyl-ACP dehydratase